MFDRQIWQALYFEVISLPVDTEHIFTLHTAVQRQPFYGSCYEPSQLQYHPSLVKFHIVYRYMPANDFLGFGKFFDNVSPDYPIFNVS